MPSWVQTGTPSGFVAFCYLISSITSGSACLISSRTRASISPRQSPNSSMILSMVAEGLSDMVAILSDTSFHATGAARGRAGGLRSSSSLPPAQARLDESLHEVERRLCHLAPAAVDRERVPAIRDPGDLGDRLIVLVALVGGVCDRPRD